MDVRLPNRAFQGKKTPPFEVMWSQKFLECSSPDWILALIRQ